MTAERRAVVFLRRPVATETQKRQETVLARTEALEASGAIGDVAVRHWKRLADLEDADSEHPTLAEMDAWAAARGVRSNRPSTATSVGAATPAATTRS